MYGFALIFLCVIQSINSEESPLTRQSLEEAWEMQLIKDLRAKHTSRVAPNETTEIHAHFFLKYFTMGEDETTFTAYSWVVTYWNDPRLKWNEDDYKGVTEVVYDSYKFWEPSMYLHNEVDVGEYSVHSRYCRLDKLGDVICVPRVLHEAACYTKLSDWPFDTQICTLQIGFFARSANLVLQKTNKAATLMGAEYASNWIIIDYSQKYKQITNPVNKSYNGTQLELTFVIERISKSLDAIVIFPTILLTVLTLSSFMLSVKDNNRLGIVCFNLLCHFLFITEMSDLIPKHSANSPTILFYLRGSIMINITLVIFIMFLVALRNKSVPTPNWISILNDTVLKSKGRFLVYPHWKVDVQKGTSEELLIILQGWADFSDILNCSCLWLITFVYLYFICMYIPRPSAVNYEDKITTSDWIKNI